MGKKKEEYRHRMGKREKSYLKQFCIYIITLVR
jgi:hypothetical protein